MNKIDCGGEILYIEGLKNFGCDGDPYVDNSIKDIISIDKLKEALNPVVKVGNIIKEGISSLTPDEVELTLQLQLGLSDEKFSFAIVNAEAQAHLSVKFVWKAENKNSEET